MNPSKTFKEFMKKISYKIKSLSLNLCALKLEYQFLKLKKYFSEGFTSFYRKYEKKLNNVMNI